jgi:hypothetical protein
MKRKVIVLSLVTTLFFTFGGCHDAVDNGAFKEPAVSVENEVASLKSSGTAAEEYEATRIVKTKGVFGLFVVYSVNFRNYDDGKIGDGSTGRLAYETIDDLKDYEHHFPATNNGNLFKVKISSIGTYDEANTGYYRYAPDGKTLYLEVSGGFWSNLSIEKTEVR